MKPGHGEILLAEGDVETASRLLGHDYFIMGRVVQGRRLGPAVERLDADQRAAGLAVTIVTGDEDNLKVATFSLGRAAASEGVAYALSLFPELFYAMFLNVVYLKGIWDLSLAKQADWKHVVQTGSGSRVES